MLRPRHVTLTPQARIKQILHFFNTPGALMCDYDLTNIQLPAVLILLNCTIHVAKTKVLISFAVILRSYCDAELRLCFRIGNNPIFSQSGSFYS